MKFRQTAGIRVWLESNYNTFSSSFNFTLSRYRSERYLKSAMPLTIAHPAIVIPIRHRLVLSALMIGSMAPDFSKIFSLSPRVTLGHSVPGVFWFCVPVGLIFFILLQHLLKKPLFLLLPANHQKRLVPWLNPFPLRTAAQWGLVIVSLIIGAFSHLFWDSFTHEHGWSVEAFPFLQSNLFTFHGRPFRIHECLQHASTVGGSIFLAACYVRFYQKASIHPLPSIPLISVKVKLILGCFFIAGAVFPALIFANTHTYRLISWKFFAGRAAVASMAFFCFELILFGIVCHFYFKKFSTAKVKKPGMIQPRMHTNNHEWESNDEECK
ncbi:DUF4184 family protein [Pedosphaera parvula]|uniref:DUF4184 family protein n=1 Tax=Pedosphaera parvula (strain Ellin514) TaxID=320771 RepID=B9XK96_PEDPL|nr:DUF4184 family protein [Pedosphaera parvula]EEF59734.1 hypothetical protein Cflav_PD2555 [Pedosphaera parvula Ellin514]